MSILAVYGRAADGWLAFQRIGWISTLPSVDCLEAPRRIHLILPSATGVRISLSYLAQRFFLLDCVWWFIEDYVHWQREALGLADSQSNQALVMPWWDTIFIGACRNSYWFVECAALGSVKLIKLVSGWIWSSNLNRNQQSRDEHPTSH